MRATSESPIFLAGTDRTGIGLLGEMLECHPEIAISRRTKFFSFYYERFGELRRTANLDRCISAMVSYRRIRDLDPDVDLLREQFLEGEPTYARLFDLLQRQRLERIGKSRWGDKSLNSERHAKRILDAYPHARIVHIVRDPRDRYASQATHRGESRGGIGAGTALWKWSIRLAERNSSIYADRYLVVRYEQLVNAPEETLTAICSFIGEEFHNDMLSAVDTEERADPVRLRTTSIGRFRKDLSPAEIAFIQLWSGRQMRRWGYEVVPTPLSPGQRVLFWLKDVPVNTLGLLLWAPNAVFRELRGRGPSRRRLVDPERDVG